MIGLTLNSKKTLRNCAILLIALSVTSAVFAKEDCSIEAIGLSAESDVAKKLFFTGTCHYRNQDYADSAASWEKLALIQEVNPKYEHLQIDVLNNLGYLKFFGHGVEEDKQQAINFWEKAVSLGHNESEYHLCHAYADSEQSTFDKSKAKKHCEKAFLVYKTLEKKSPDDEKVLSIIEEYLAKIQ